MSTQTSCMFWYTLYVCCYHVLWTYDQIYEAMQKLSRKMSFVASRVRSKWSCWNIGRSASFLKQARAFNSFVLLRCSAHRINTILAFVRFGVSVFWNYTPTTVVPTQLNFEAKYMWSEGCVLQKIAAAKISFASVRSRCTVLHRT